MKLSCSNYTKLTSLKCYEWDYFKFTKIYDVTAKAIYRIYTLNIK